MTTKSPQQALADARRAKLGAAAPVAAPPPAPAPAPAAVSDDELLPDYEAIVLPEMVRHAFSGKGPNYTLNPDDVKLIYLNTYNVVAFFEAQADAPPQQKK